MSKCPGVTHACHNFCALGLAAWGGRPCARGLPQRRPQSLVATLTLERDRARNMAAAEPDPALFTQLETLLKSDNHEEAIPVCDQILAAAPGDEDALHAKVVSLIEMSKMDEALKLIEASPALATVCAFERAYCLYQLQREDEALKLLMPGGAEPKESRELQLAGQIMYRQGKSAKAAAFFQQSEEISGPSEELSTNILAALVSAGQGAEALEYAHATGAGSSSSDEDTTHFELYYNHACAAIAVNQLSLAQSLLQKAIDVCRKTLSSEDYTEEEVEVRDAPKPLRGPATTVPHTQPSQRRLPGARLPVVCAPARRPLSPAEGTTRAARSSHASSPHSPG